MACESIATKETQNFFSIDFNEYYNTPERYPLWNILHKAMPVIPVSATLMNIFVIQEFEGEIHNAFSRLSDYLGEEYENLLNAIRNAPSSHMDQTSQGIDGNPCQLWAS
ncbi:MAG: hypothetical protein ACP5OC_08190 [Thermoplasmata archaeon]